MTTANSRQRQRDAAFRREGAPSLGASRAAPLGCVWQYEQVQAGDQEQGERKYRQEAQPIRVLLLDHGDDVDDDGHGKGYGQPAVELPHPFVPVQWDLL